jgi:hypothetical protein
MIRHRLEGTWGGVLDWERLETEHLTDRRARIEELNRRSENRMKRLARLPKGKVTKVRLVEAGVTPEDASVVVARVHSSGLLGKNKPSVVGQKFGVSWQEVERIVRRSLRLLMDYEERGEDAA